MTVLDYVDNNVHRPRERAHDAEAHPARDGAGRKMTLRVAELEQKEATR